jgi:hypothetical protein
VPSLKKQDSVLNLAALTYKQDKIAYGDAHLLKALDPTRVYSVFQALKAFLVDRITPRGGDSRLTNINNLEDRTDEVSIVNALSGGLLHRNDFI